jgi:hypothetical protein
MLITVTLNARLQPRHRADLEDAFDGVMLKYQHAAQVVGGGTLQNHDGETIACEIEIESDSSVVRPVDIVRRAFEAMLAPKGSYMSVQGESARIAFGVQDGLALYLNGTDLPEDVYRNCDSNHVYAECNRLIEGIGRVESYWSGPKETALYMYGIDFHLMHEKLRPFLEAYPLCRQSRIEKVA